MRRLVAASLASRGLHATAHVIAQPAFGWVSFALAFSDIARGAALSASAPVARVAPHRARLLRRDRHAGGP
jgi:hypothetical protein